MRFSLDHVDDGFKIAEAYLLRMDLVDELSQRLKAKDTGWVSQDTVNVVEAEAYQTALRLDQSNLPEGVRKNFDGACREFAAALKDVYFS